LSKLLTRINDKRTKPLVIKMPHLIDSTKNNTLKIPELLEMVSIITENNIDGITIANSMPIIDSRLSTGNGGMSGKPLFNNMIKIIQEIDKEFKGKIKIHACGGIFSGEDAWSAIKAGAETIQIYSSFIYRGPTIASLINSELLKLKKNSS
jgi:dihydroorotate dehydrogenase